MFSVSGLFIAELVRCVIAYNRAIKKKARLDKPTSRGIKIMKRFFRFMKNKPKSSGHEPSIVNSKVDWGWVSRRPNDAVFQDCSIENVDLSKSGLNGIQISDCELSGGSIKDSTFKGVTFKRKTQLAKG